MGAGISREAKRKKIFGMCMKVQRLLNKAGVATKYAKSVVSGDNLAVFVSTVGPASNGESFGWIVLRFNPISNPDAAVKREGDIDYTDFHERDIAEHSLGGLDAGIKRVADLHAERRAAQPQQPVDPRPSAWSTEPVRSGHAVAAG